MPWPTSSEIENCRENQSTLDQEPKDLTDCKGSDETRKIRPPLPERSSPHPTETTQVRSSQNDVISTQPINRPKMTLKTMELRLDQRKSKLLCFSCCVGHFWFSCNTLNQQLQTPVLVHDKSSSGRFGYPTSHREIGNPKAFSYPSGTRETR